MIHAPKTQRVAAIRARRMLDSEYERSRSSTLSALNSKLRAAGVRMDPADLEGHYNHAWHTLYVKLTDGERIDNPGGFITQAAYFRAVDAFRKEHLDRRTEVREIAATDTDLDSRIDDADDLRAFVQGLKGRLSDRDLQAAGLCYVYGYSRAEAAEALDVTPRQIKKTMDRVSKVVTDLVGDLRGGRWCEQQRSLITAYAMHVLDPDGERHQLAQDHLADCPACRAHVRKIRGISAAVPPLPLLIGSLGAVTGGSGALAGSGAPSSLLRRLHLLQRTPVRLPGRVIAAATASTSAACVVAVVAIGPQPRPADHERAATPIATTYVQAAETRPVSPIVAPRAASRPSTAATALPASTPTSSADRTSTERPGTDRPSPLPAATPPATAPDAAPDAALLEFSVTPEWKAAADAPAETVADPGSEPIEPSQPPAPDASVGSPGPAATADPASPAAPEAPETPEKPAVDPAEQTEPQTPDAPVDPQTPDTPVDPQTPDTPVDPQTPDTPDVPVDPVDPVDPQTPVRPCWRWHHHHPRHCWHHR